MAVRRQLSLVAFYGRKPRLLHGLIAAAQSAIAQRSSAFRPYAPEQVHATVVGLEAALVPGAVRPNRNFYRGRGELREMHLGGFLSFLKADAHWPLVVQLGGFDPHGEPFTSRGLSPFERSFSIAGDKAVLMGWPVEPAGNGPALTAQVPTAAAPERRRYPSRLHELRRRAQSFGILHAWHRTPTDIDNDFYLRLGTFAASVDDADADRIHAAVRAILGVERELEVQLRDLVLVSYVDESLPLHSTRACRVTDTNVDAFIAQESDVG